MKLSFAVKNGPFTIHQLPPDSAIPEDIFRSSFYSISKTEDELSVVCLSSIPIISGKSDAGWSCLKVMETLDFSLTGILADITAVLAKVGISVFAISTYNTDYVLVKSDHLENARKALQEAGYTLKD